jgi:hypothetical protein
MDVFIEVSGYRGPSCHTPPRLASRRAIRQPALPIAYIASEGCRMLVALEYEQDHTADEALDPDMLKKMGAHKIDAPAS